VLEARLDHIPLPTPERAIAGQQTIAEDGSEPSNFRGATKCAAIFHENFFNIVGMTEKDNLPAQNAKLYSIAVFSKDAREEREGIPLYRNEHSQKRQAIDAH
jgi:hypothetical protein